MEGKTTNGHQSTSARLATASPATGAHLPTSKSGDAKPKAHRPIISPTRAKVLIVHRTPLMRFALSALIGKSVRFIVCGETDSAPDAREIFDRNRPHLIVLGLTHMFLRYARNAASLHRASRDLRFSGSLSPRKFVPFGRDRPLMRRVLGANVAPHRIG